MVSTRRSAIEEAMERWDIGGHRAEQRKHDHLMDTLAFLMQNQLEPHTPNPRIDPYKWRRKKLKAQGGRCPRCLGKGWVPASRYCHYDDFVDCPLCGPLEARNRRSTGPVTAF